MPDELSTGDHLSPAIIVIVPLFRIEKYSVKKYFAGSVMQHMDSPMSLLKNIKNFLQK